MCYLSDFFWREPFAIIRTLLESCMSGRRRHRTSSSLDVPTSPRFSGTKAYIFNNAAFRSSPLSLFLAVCDHPRRCCSICIFDGCHGGKGWCAPCIRDLYLTTGVLLELHIRSSRNPSFAVGRAAPNTVRQSRSCSLRPHPRV